VVSGMPAAQVEQGNGAAGFLQLAQSPSGIDTCKWLIGQGGRTDCQLAHRHVFFRRNRLLTSQIKTSGPLRFVD
jgi:hypothetical protein